MSDIDFKNMNYTEWWMVKEQMQAGLCEVKVSGWCEAYTTSVVTPSGDIYIIEDWDGIIDSVKKLKRKDNEDLDGKSTKNN